MCLIANQLEDDDDDYDVVHSKVADKLSEQLQLHPPA